MAPSHRQPQYHRRLVGFAPIFCRGATVRRSGLAAGHVGEGEGQIAQVVLQKARALYLKKVSEGAVKNPCYFAMDATRPGGLGRRFYVICETEQTFRAVPVGHGNGRDLKGIVDFANALVRAV